jgi:hypothetical protein
MMFAHFSRIENSNATSTGVLTSSKIPASLAHAQAWAALVHAFVSGERARAWERLI